MIEVITDIQQWIKIRENLKSHGQKIGFVPTMGALHEGHLSLIKKSLKETTVTLVSLFINPTQFDNPNDLKNYPQKLERDIDLLKSITQDSPTLHYVLIPTSEQMYPDQYHYKVTENQLSQQLCGAHRPGHFDGVLTVVLKLLNLAGAEKAYFGEKDYQQYLLIKNMVEAFFIPTEIIPCPTIREKSGLAMSSRNLRLSKKEQSQAALIYKTLQQKLTINQTKSTLKEQGLEVDYVEDIKDRRFVAAHVGNVRLIDNVQL